MPDRSRERPPRRPRERPRRPQRPLRGEPGYRGGPGARDEAGYRDEPGYRGDPGSWMGTAVEPEFDDPSVGLGEEARSAARRAGAARGGEGGGRPAGRRIARNTAIFSVFTGLSRIAGLVREIVAASYFGTSGPASAFTLAFQVPNLVRSLFADAALSAAFVPVFTELLEQRRRREAFQLASTLFFIILLALGAITALFILAAGVVMPLFTGSHFTAADTTLTVGLSQVLFPIVLLLGLNGLLVGILQTYDHFSIPAISPLVWNVVIIVLLALLRSHYHGGDQLYAYAIGVLVATVVQLLMAFAALRRIDFRLELHVDWRDPRIKQVFSLMLPVTIGLGIINVDLLINSSFGTLVSDQAPRAIDSAFRIYMLPQGMFSVAVATVLFPALASFAARRDVDRLRATMSTGIRQINLLLIPSAVFLVVLSVPVVRVIYQHGSFNAHSTDQVSLALFWFAFSLPFAGVNLLLTRTFFSLQRPWIPTRLALYNVIVDTILSLALYKPFGIAGLVIGTAVANAGMTIGQGWQLRRLLGGRIDGHQTTMITARIAVASLLLAAGSWLVWYVCDSVLGRSLIAQIVAMSAAAGAGLWIYTRAVLRMRVPEATQVRMLLRARLGRA